MAFPSKAELGAFRQVVFSINGCNNVSTSTHPSRIMPLLTQGRGLIPTPLNLGGLHCNQECGTLNHQEAAGFLEAAML